MEARSLLTACLGLAAAIGACSDSGHATSSSMATGSGGTGQSATATGVGGGSTGAFSTGASMGPFDDFPADPILDGGAPANAPTLFGPPDSGAPTGGPCLLEPQIGSLFPQNWLRPRFRFIPTAGETLFEIRLTAASQINPLVVYTTNPTWTMTKPIWDLLATHTVDEPINVQVRGAAFDGTTIQGQPMLGSSGTISIAPVEAPGTIVYWTTSGGSSLKGFTVGDESVISALTPPQVQMKTSGGAQVTCLGCHTSTPDGLYASFVGQSPWSNVLASVQGMNVGAQPAFLGAGATTFLEGNTALGIHTYSKGHWVNGDHIMVTPQGDGAAAKLIWVDLEATGAGMGQAWGEIARTGDSHGVGAPAWTHDGNTIIYVSNDTETTGRLDAGPADLYSVPYNNKAGGAATPITGASDPAYEEYYPAISGDDQLLAFSRIPTGLNMYDQAQAEVFLTPIAGGTPTRLAANDPPACSGAVSPGVTNSWPKWAPGPGTTGPKGTYYWAVFSSRRDPSGRPQLYIAAVLVPIDGTAIQTFPALYLWNQPSDENNHTPAWDTFAIPVVPPS